MGNRGGFFGTTLPPRQVVRPGEAPAFVLDFIRAAVADGQGLAGGESFAHFDLENGAEDRQGLVGRGQTRERDVQGLGVLFLQVGEN